MIVVFWVFFQIYYYHNVKCRREMFDKDIVMLQVTMYTSLHFFKYFQSVCMFGFIFIRTFLREKSQLFLWKDFKFLILSI